MSRRVRSGNKPGALPLLGAVLGWCLALVPGTLGRTALITGIAGAALALIGLVFGHGLGYLTNRTAPASRRLIVGIGGFAALAAAGATWWQINIAATLGTAAPNPWWPVVALGALGVVLGTAALPGHITLSGLALATAICAPVGHAGAESPVIAPPGVIYGHLSGDESDFDSRATVLVGRWAAQPRADALVITVPTGSGWVDSSAIRGLHAYFGGDVQFLSMQYSNVPSWQAYLRSPAKAGESATALLKAVARELRRHRGSDSTDVYLYGQSLGAIGADRARSWAQHHDVPVAGTVLVGAPAGTIMDVPPCTNRVVIANASDPVALFSTDLIWRPERRTGVIRSGPEVPFHLPWIPGVSFIASGIDLIGSLDGPTGTGHRYGTEQGRALRHLARRTHPAGGAEDCDNP